jgi:catechol 2,3-dioxygenase-like lactoylglutathione lyase family enzyme
MSGDTFRWSRRELTRRNDWQRAMKPNAILETVLYATDLDAIEAFYREVLGLEPSSVMPGRQVFYKLDGQMLLIFNPDATERPPPPHALPVPPHGARGPGHVCFRATAAEIDGWRQRLSQLGIALDADFEWPQGGRSIYFRDPAGNSIEFAEARIWGLA